MPDTLVEVWQANAAGRYRHAGDQHPAPLDPNFTGRGRCSPTPTAATASSRSSPAPIRGATTTNAWRPAHIHFSLFGRAFTQRLVTQMYFPGDPLFAHDPIFSRCATRRRASGWWPRSTSTATEPEWALAFRFDIVLRGRAATPLEERPTR